MHVLWHHGVNSGRLTVNEFVAITSTNAAKIFNIYPRKGSISVGADADIAIWDPERERTISVNEHHQNIDTNIFEGMTVKGINHTTIAQGKIVYQDGEVRTERGVGRYIDRPVYPPYYAAMERMREANAPSAVNRSTPAAE
jgi:dihydropyrimidinase